MGTKGSPPAAPDYEKLLPLQHKANIGAFDYTTGTQRVNTVTPWGSQTWSYNPQGAKQPWQGGQQPTAGSEQPVTSIDPTPASNGDEGTSYSGAAAPQGQPGEGIGSNIEAPDPGQWTLHQTLSPEQQKLYDQDLRFREQMGNTAEGMLGGVMSRLGQQQNFADQLPGFQSVNAPNLSRFTPTGRGLSQPQYNGPNSISDKVMGPGSGRVNASYNGPGAADAMAAGQTIGGYNGPGMGDRPNWQGPQYDATTRGRAEEAYFNRATRLLEPKMQESERALRDDLISQGFNLADTGASRQMNDLRERNASQRANIADAAVQFGGDEATGELNRALSAENARFGAGMQGANFDLNAAGQSFDKNYQRATGQQGLDLDRIGMGAGLGQQDWQRQFNMGTQGFDQGLRAAEFNRGLFRDDADLAQRGWERGVNQRDFGRQLNMDSNNLAMQRYGQEKDRSQFFVNEQNRQQNWAQQSIAQQQADRARPLQEFNSLRTGQQPYLPSMQGQYGGQSLQAPNIMGAAQQSYDNALGSHNAQQAGDDAFMQGLFGLAGAATGNPWLMAGLMGIGAGAGGRGNFSGISF